MELRIYTHVKTYHTTGQSFLIAPNNVILVCHGHGLAALNRIHRQPH